MGLLDADKMPRLDEFGDDSCALLEAIEKSFGVEFDTDDLVEAETVGLLNECITRKLASKRTGNESSANDVFPALRKLIAAEIGMKSERISAETRFPKGLKIY